ncbi:hypothetical protein C0Q70_05720 [Pomacea canaliculata]|uniref:Uncharacterized protein n=1 Tax=Pomacea canaliculata TaxID=400727 RepID=A0A2T7PM35_POMCA|nr:hypothetical protein C0Q70_05720 [Pomacea canaliculata]
MRECNISSNSAKKNAWISLRKGPSGEQRELQHLEPVLKLMSTILRPRATSPDTAEAYDNHAVCSGMDRRPGASYGATVTGVMTNRQVPRKSPREANPKPQTTRNEYRRLSFLAPDVRVEGI